MSDAPDSAEAVASVRARRGAGWSDEIAFCDHWLRTRGFNWPEDYRRKTDPRARIQIPHRFLPPEATRLRRFLARRRLRISILDVGSGPLSLVGARLPGVEVELVPVDPLAAEYNELLDLHGVSPPVRTRPCPAERVADVLGEARFDLVYCQNALDHTEDPLGGLEQMLRAVKPGRWVLLKHVIDEGETRGLRQPARLELQDRGRQVRDLEPRDAHLPRRAPPSGHRRRGRPGRRGGLHLGPGRDRRRAD